MRLAIVTTADQGLTTEVREAAVARGHLILECNDPEAEACILLVDADSPDRMASAWQELANLQDRGISADGLTVTPIAELPRSVASMPHKGEWIEIKRNSPDTVCAAFSRIEDTHGSADGSDGLAKTSRRNRWRDKLRKSKHEIIKGADPGDSAPGGLAIFISYSRKDELSQDVIKRIQKSGHRVWVDTTSIHAGDRWRASIEKAIKSADLFVLLVSPAMVENADNVETELEIASKHKKRLIPVYVRRITHLPDGFEITISGIQRIPLYPSFDEGMGRLLEQIGPASATEPRSGISTALSDARDNVNRFMHQHEVGAKTKKYGAAFAAGAAAALVVAAKVVSARDEQQRVMDREQYITRTLDLLTTAFSEISLTNGMSPQEYRVEFRPRYAGVLGALNELRPPASFKQRHEELVRSLEVLSSDLDQAVAQFESGQTAGYARAIDRVNDKWVRTVRANIEWLKATLAQSGIISAEEA